MTITIDKRGQSDQIMLSFQEGEIDKDNRWTRDDIEVRSENFKVSYNRNLLTFEWGGFFFWVYDPAMVGKMNELLHKVYNGSRGYAFREDKDNYPNDLKKLMGQLETLGAKLLNKLTGSDYKKLIKLVKEKAYRAGYYDKADDVRHHLSEMTSGWCDVPKDIE